MEKKRILLVDDDELITMSLEMIISAEADFEIVGKGGSGREAVALYDELEPDLLLMDIRMADMNGLEAAEEILSKHRDATILFLTTFSDDEYIVKALKLGVKGYLLKQDYKSLPAALHAAINGQSVFGGAVIDKLPTLMNQANTDDEGLIIVNTIFQKKNLKSSSLLLKASPTKKSPRSFSFRKATVRNYLSTILEKLNLRDRTQLAIFYLKHE